MDWTILMSVLITALVSPVFLKWIEYTFSKASERERHTQARLDGLAARVDELKELNTQQSVKIGIQQAKIEAQQEEIRNLQSMVRERNERIAEMQKQLNTLQNRKDNRIESSVK